MYRPSKTLSIKVGQSSLECGNDGADLPDIQGTDVMSSEWISDINVVSGALKLWLRELPEPLMTYGLYNEFIEAARELPLRDEPAGRAHSNADNAQGMITSV